MDMFDEDTQQRLRRLLSCHTAGKSVSRVASLFLQTLSCVGSACDPPLHSFGETVSRTKNGNFYISPYLFTRLSYRAKCDFFYHNRRLVVKLAMPSHFGVFEIQIPLFDRFKRDCELLFVRASGTFILHVHSHRTFAAHVFCRHGIQQVLPGRHQSREHHNWRRKLPGNGRCSARWGGSICRSTAPSQSSTARMPWRTKESQES